MSLRQITFVACWTAVAIGCFARCAQAQLESSDLVGAWTVQLRVGTEDQPARLPFELRLKEQVKDGQPLAATLVNGREFIAAGPLELTSDRMEIEFPHYNSTLELHFQTHRRAEGNWRKVRYGGRVAEVPLVCEPRAPVDWEDPTNFLGRWSVAFADEEEPAVGIFKAGTLPGEVFGTFLTTTGDYRYLAGGVQNGQLRLSCFDGAHAFLFEATLVDEKLEGNFYSGNWYQTQWVAHRDADAALPDAFTQTTWVGRVPLGELRFPTPNGERLALDDPRFAGKCRIIEVFGSWCPNCHDAGVYLTELHERYRDRGLSILGLAFELSGDFDRDARQVQRFIDRHGTRYPVLIAGTADKAAATAKLQLLDQIRSYPTFIFLDQSGQVQAIYSGFSGPATEEAHQRLRSRFEALIHRLLDEA